MNSDLGVYQIGVGCARGLDHGYGKGSIRQLQDERNAVGIFNNLMDGTLYFHPLCIFRAGFEHSEADARRVRRERSGAEDANLTALDHGTEASRSADPAHVHQRSDEQWFGRLAGQLANHLDKDVAGIIVNEDGRLSSAEVGIEVGDNPLKMDQDGALGLFIGEAVRFACCGDRPQSAGRILRGLSMGQRLQKTQTSRKQDRKQEGRNHEKAPGAYPREANLS